MDLVYENYINKIESFWANKSASSPSMPIKYKVNGQDHECMASNNFWNIINCINEENTNLNVDAAIRLLNKSRPEFLAL